MREYCVTYRDGGHEATTLVLARSEIEAAEVFRRKHGPNCVIRKVNLK